MPCLASRPIPPATSRGRRTGCCPSKHATSVDGPQGGCGGRPASQRHWQPGPSPHSARTTAAAAEAPPHPWTGCGDTRVRGSSGERPKDPLPLSPPPTSPQPHLQSGTTMGLSSMPRKSPRSFRAASTAFLASNLGRPWVGDGPRHGHAEVPHRLSTRPPHPRQSHQERRGHVDEGPSGIHDADGLQPVPLPNLIVVLVVCGGDLHCTWGVRGGAGARGTQRSLLPHTPPFTERCGSQTTLVSHFSSSSLKPSPSPAGSGKACFFLFEREDG